MRKALWSALLIAVSFCLAVPVFAAPPGIDFVPAGSGARALGMGGAFTSIADDATAAWWNPAGLSQLERPEISIVGENTTFDGAMSLTYTPAVSSPVNLSGSSSKTGLNFASVVMPLGGKSAGARKAVSLSYGTLVNLDSDLHDNAGNYQKWSGSFDNATLAFATELTPELSLGVSAIRYMGGYTNEMLFPIVQIKVDVDFSGTGYAAGILWKKPAYGAGFIYRSSFRLKWEDAMNVLDLENRYPASWGGGVFYRPVENFTVSVDLQFVDMSSFIVRGDPERYGDVYQPRVGLEYLIITRGQNIIPLRAGWFDNPQPSKDINGNQAKGQGYSIGTGIVFKDFQIDVAYIKASRDAYKHNLVDQPPVLTIQQNVTKQDLSRFLLSAIYRF